MNEDVLADWEAMDESFKADPLILANRK